MEGYERTMYFNGQEVATLSPGQLKEGEYSVGQFIFNVNKSNLLGEGGMAKVYKGKSRTDSSLEVAIKVLKLKKDKKDTLKECRQEILRQQLLKSDGVVKIYSSKIISMQDDRVFVIASQFMNGGQLKVPKDVGYPSEQAKHLLTEIIKSYSTLYKKGIIHRDLKPQNILTTKEGKIKISDFGTASEKNDKREAKNIMTPQYASPQQRACREHTDKCDVYALGCIFFQLLTGNHPKGAGCAKSYNKMDMEKVYNALDEKNVPKNIVQFLQGCLREKQLVEMDGKDGAKMQDHEKSRLSWQAVYLHPLFKGKLNYIPREVAGRDLLLSMTINAKIRSVDLTGLLQKQLLQSTKLDKGQLNELLERNKLPVNEGNIDRLLRIFGGNTYIQIRQLLNDLGKLDEEQYSQYSPQEARAFLQLFTAEGEQDRLRLLKVMNNFETGSYKQTNNLELFAVNLTSFPLLPEMTNLKYIDIIGGNIQVLEARLNTPNLERLNLSRCEIQRILTIRGCPKLSKLTLNNNKLRAIEGLQFLSRLNQLCICGNRLYRIQNIDHLQQLTQLALVSNRISVIEGLAGCISLNDLNLRVNRITQLSEDLLEYKNIPLSYVNLTMNNIVGSQKNRQILKQFKKWHTKSEVHMVEYYEQQGEFKDVKQLGNFENGQYVIFNCDEKKACLGIEFQRGNQGSKSIQVTTFNEEPTQVWRLKKYEGNEYILFASTGEIVRCHGDLTLVEYDEQGEQQQSYQFRWTFEKEGQRKGIPFYKMKPVADDRDLIHTGAGLFLNSFGQCRDRSDCWWLKAVKNKQN